MWRAEVYISSKCSGQVQGFLANSYRLFAREMIRTDPKQTDFVDFKLLLRELQEVKMRLYVVIRLSAKDAVDSVLMWCVLAHRTAE